MSVTIEDSAETKAMSAYLNDHLAGETLALELATRASVKHEGTRLGTFLLLLSWELAEDRESLVSLMSELGIRRRRVGAVAAGIAEKVGRLKRTGRSPLRTLDELEILDLRIKAKLDMWTTLRSSVGRGGVDFDELIGRAERQAEALERRRLAVRRPSMSL